MSGTVTYLLTAKVIDMNADPLVEFSTLGAYVMTVPAGAAVLMDNVASGVDLLGYVRHEDKYYAVKLFHTVLAVEAPRTSLVLTWAASSASLIVDAAARLRSRGHVHALLLEARRAHRRGGRRRYASP